MVPDSGRGVSVLIRIARHSATPVRRLWDQTRASASTRLPSRPNTQKEEESMGEARGWGCKGTMFVTIMSIGSQSIYRLQGSLESLAGTAGSQKICNNSGANFTN